MYSGKLMNELMQMVARAEEHAHQLQAQQVESDPYIAYASHFIYDGVAPQHALVGAA